MIDLLQSDWNEQRPDLDSESIGVVLRIQALARILVGQAESRLDDFGLQWWQYDVLSALRRQGAPYTLSATELAAEGMLTSGAMTNRIDRLEEDALVARKDDPADRRRVLVSLTRKGLGLVERATAARFESAVSALAHLDARERQVLSDLLRKVLLAQPDLNNDGTG